MKRLILLPLFLLAGCVATYGGPACTNVTEDLCDICPKNDNQARVCTCVREGTLTAGDFPDGTDITDDEAARQCSRIRNSLEFPGVEDAATCRANLEYINDWDVDACEDLGWTGD